MRRKNRSGRWTVPPTGHKKGGDIKGIRTTEGKNQALVGALPFCGEYPGPRSEDKFRSSNEMDGISIADGGKMADS